METENAASTHHCLAHAPRRPDPQTFRAGSALLRQLHFATTDLELHSDYVPGGAGAGTAFDVERRLAAKTAVMPPLPEDRFLCGFSHSASVTEAKL